MPLPPALADLPLPIIGAPLFIWGCAQGIAAVKHVVPARALIERLAHELGVARGRLALQ
ncbi:MAG: hypothetical protein WA210_12285 [Burkholderiaceae bacterium]